MASFRNPAGRLHNLFAAVLGVGSDRSSTKEAWSIVFETDKDTELLREYADACRLPWDIWRQLGSLPKESLDLATRHLYRFEEALLFPMNNPWKQLVDHIQGEPMLSLEFVSHLLDQAKTEPLLEEDLLLKWKEDLDRLDSDISEATEVGSDLRWFLRDHIRSMGSAIKALPGDWPRSN